MPERTMQAISVQDDDPRSLVLQTVPRPTPGPGEVLIRVRAAGVNRLDWLQRQGHYPVPPGASQILGLEVAGEIIETGPDAAPWSNGDRVCALLSGGGYAEYAVAPASTCLPIPDGWDDAEAASLPEATFTVWSNCVEQAAIKPDDTVLIHGGASGVGVYAIQMLSALGHTVYATAGNADKCAACQDLGAAAAINYKTEDFVAALRQRRDGRGIDIILDMVGGETTSRNLQLLNTDGRILLIAFQAGRHSQIDLAHLLAKRARLIGSTLRARPIADKARIASALKDRILPLLTAKAIRPVVHARIPLAEAGKAHDLMLAHDYVGKLVLTL